MNIGLVFVLVTPQPFNSLTFSIIYANLLMRNNILAWYFATYQKLLIRYGTGDFYLNFDKSVLMADFEIFEIIDNILRNQK